MARPNQSDVHIDCTLFFIRVIHSFRSFASTTAFEQNFSS